MFYRIKKFYWYLRAGHNFDWHDILPPRLYWLGFHCFCPVCRSFVRTLLPYPPHNTTDACPVCRALQRHRLAWIFLKRHTNLFDRHDKLMLHFAPEISFTKRLKNILGRRYITADIQSSIAAVRTDITAIAFSDNSFDVVYASHVLEHIPDDHNAMRELRRVLKPYGWGVIQVPLATGPTVEDPTVVEPEERLRLFGQHDHVRQYGDDFAERFSQHGFQVSSLSARTLIGKTWLNRYKIDPNEILFLVRKR